MGPGCWEQVVIFWGVGTLAHMLSLAVMTMFGCDGCDSCAPLFMHKGPGTHASHLSKGLLRMWPALHSGDDGWLAHVWAWLALARRLVHSYMRHTVAHFPGTMSAVLKRSEGESLAVDGSCNKGATCTSSLVSLQCPAECCTLPIILSAP